MTFLCNIIFDRAKQLFSEVIQISQYLCVCVCVCVCVLCVVCVCVCVCVCVPVCVCVCVPVSSGGGFVMVTTKASQNICAFLRLVYIFMLQCWLTTKEAIIKGLLLWSLMSAGVLGGW